MTYVLKDDSRLAKPERHEHQRPYQENAIGKSICFGHSNSDTWLLDNQLLDPALELLGDEVGRLWVEDCGIISPAPAKSE